MSVAKPKDGLLAAIGLMSGTSMDGIDAALVWTDGMSAVKTGAALTVPYGEAFRRRLQQYQVLRQKNPDVLAALWWEGLGPVFAKLHAAGRLELLDNCLGPDGLDIMQIGPRMQKK